MASQTNRNIPSEGQALFSSDFCTQCYTPLDQVAETFCPACGVALPIQFSESRPE